ncbi:hypothetical protein G6F50_017500 [Rhizopus delemar]|uniref:Uncharacterized protein n=1 Tax=Rhizopus delemar TaxID=936053 RepID=A0A9P7C035_9FUNG|nr:hypothetical protein G6F50_017500 [Rhizopus delemar]
MRPGGRLAGGRERPPARTRSRQHPPACAARTAALHHGRFVRGGRACRGGRRARRRSRRLGARRADRAGRDAHPGGSR